MFRKSDYGSRIGRIQILWAVIILYTVAAKTFSTIRPNSRSQIELEITADQPYVTDKPQATGTPVTSPPTATVEKVELVYFVSNPRYTTDPNAEYPYLQPAWRFYGHYSNRDEFDVLIQALTDEYLLPELAPSIPPG